MSTQENLLFTSKLISPEVQAALPKGYTIRPLASDDYERGFLDVLSVLTVIGNITKAQFLGTLTAQTCSLTSHNHEYFTLVIVSPQNRIVGAGTIFVERKFIRNTGLVGHIEDIAVDKNQQGKKLGLRIIQALKYTGAKTGCYKVILDCSEKNVNNIDFREKKLKWLEGGGVFVFAARDKNSKLDIKQSPIERFWSPRGQSGKSTNINVVHENNSHNNSGYLWRLKMFPNGVDKKSNDYISLYLEAIQTHYEKQNSITGRHKKFRLALYRVDSNIQTTKQRPILVIDRHTLETKFEFNGVHADYGFARIIALKELFPNDTTLTEVDLLVRTQIFEDTITPGEGSSSMDIVSNISLMPFERYFGEERFCDVEFVFDCGSSMKAHRVILAARSMYFERMLGGEWMENHMKTIAIRDMPFDAFRCIVHHLYTGKLEEGLTFELLRDIYSKADMLSLEQLGQMAAKRMVNLMTHDNWDQVLMLGWKFYDDRLKDAGQEFAVKHWNVIKDSENMKQVLASGHVDRIVELVLQSFFTPNNTRI
ncbi:8508_t:CDS:2, partial [Funneliformis mosseae]